MEGFEQFGLDHGCDQRIVNASALSSAWDVVWRGGRCQHRIDNMDDSIARVDISRGDSCTVHHDAVANCEREWLSVHGGCRHAFGHCGGWNGTRDHVVEQDVCKNGLSFRSVKGSQVNASINEGLIGWCKEREWPFALEGFEQFGLDDCGHE